MKGTKVMTAQKYYGRGRDRLSGKEYGEAIADFTEALRLKPDHAGARLYRAEAYCAKEEYGKAIADFDEAVRLKPDNPNAYRGRGMAYNMTGERDKAIADFTAAIGFAANIKNAGGRIDDLCYWCRGHTYCAKGEYGKAIDDFTEVIRISMEKAEREAGRAEGNIEKLKGRMAGFPEGDTLEGWMAMVEMETGWRNGQDESTASHNRVYIAPAHFHRGEAFRSLGQYGEAIADFEAAVSLDPECAEAREALRELLGRA